MMPRVGWFRLASAMLILMGISGCMRVATAKADECSNEQVRRAEVYALALPDCRAYEQVSPVEKNLTDAQGFGGQVWSAPSGEGVTFFTSLALPIGSGSGEFPTYVAGRDQVREEWKYEGLLPSTNPEPFPGAGGFVITENLETSIVSVGPQGPLLAAGAQPDEEDWYIHANGTESYRFVASGEHFSFADATPDGSHIIFEDRQKLTENAQEFEGNPEATNLYEWAGGRLSLVGVLPHGEVPATGGSVAGPGGPAIEEKEGGVTERELPGGAAKEFYTHDTISDNGSRIFFTDVETGQIFLRKPEVEETIPVSSGSAYWRAATPDGAYAFYTEGKGQERNLYRFNVNTQKSEALTSGTAHVLGTLGISNDGSYVYFAAEEKLASGAQMGRANLYELHVGEPPVFIADLSASVEDSSDWTDFPNGSGPAQERTSSRVAPEGKSVLFTSHEQLTLYDNHKEGEIYLYSVLDDGLTCVSCNPSGVLATSEAQLTDHFVQGPLNANAFLTRNLSSEGNRAFFQTREALLPQDTNDQMDVYEWEQEGMGSCDRASASFSKQDEGCLYLISTAQSASESYFGDASENGSNVFFFTRQPLVAQDQDQSSDLYDAREGGGFAGQNRESAVSCTGEEGCRGPSASAPIFSVPSSVTLSGAGNAAQPAEESNPIKRTVKPVTRAQKLTAALKGCGRKPRGKRARCRARAQKKYGTNAKKSNRGSK